MGAPWRRHIGGLRRERIHASAQWRNDAFVNATGATAGLAPGTGWPLLREYLRAGQRRTPPRPLPAHDPRASWLTPSASRTSRCRP